MISLFLAGCLAGFGGDPQELILAVKFTGPRGLIESPLVRDVDRTECSINMSHDKRDWVLKLTPRVDGDGTVSITYAFLQTGGILVAPKRIPPGLSGAFRVTEGKQMLLYIRTSDLTFLRHPKKLQDGDLSLSIVASVVKPD